MDIVKTNKITLGKCLKILRNEKHITLDQLAANMQLSKANVWQMENGKTSPTFDSICYFTKFYNFDFISFESIYEIDDLDESSLKNKIDQHRINSINKSDGTSAEEARLKDMVIELQQDVINLHKELKKAISTKSK